MSARRRLDRLENWLTVTPSTGQVTKDLHEVLERAAPFVAGWSLLATTMAPEHVARAEAVFAGAFHWTHPRSGTPFHLSFVPDPYDADPFATVVGRIVRSGVRGAHRGPFTFPPTVASVYASADTVLNSWDECSACGYGLPRPYFESGCPLCGCWVGANAYYREHRAPAPLYAFPAALIAQAREELTPQIRTWLQAGPLAEMQ